MRHPFLKSLLIFGFCAVCARVSHAAINNDQDIDTSTETGTDIDPAIDDGIRKPIVITTDIKNARDAKKKSQSQFVEILQDPKAPSVSLYSAPDSTKPIGQLSPGEIVTVQPVAASAKSNWRQIQVDGAEVIWFKFDSKTMRSFNTDPPARLRLRPLTGKEKQDDSQPLYREPGFWTPADCARDSSLCVAAVGQNSTLLLLKNQFRTVDKSRQKGRLLLNFYQVARLRTEEAGAPSVPGWLPSTMLTPRTAGEDDDIKASVPPTPIADIRDEDQNLAVKPNGESGLFVFEKNAADPEQRKRLIREMGVPGLKTESVESIAGLTVRYQGAAGATHIQVNQPFAGPDYQVDAARVGGGISTNLFIDLQLKFNLDVSIPISSSDKNSSAKGFYLDSQGWFIYTTGWKLNQRPLKVGLGAYYLSFSPGKEVGGLPGVAGFQAKLVFEGEKLSGAIRFAPVAQDLNLNFQNRLVGLEAFYNLDWEIDYRPVQIRANFEDIFYRNPTSQDYTSLKVIGLGLNFPVTF